jgi:predicted nucleic acid-binding protein
MVNAVILDASVWLAVILQEEDSESFKTVLEKSSLLAPELIKCETANGILNACRRNLTPLKKSSLDHYFKFIHEFPIQLLPLDLWWNDSVNLVKRHALTFYDAAYLGAAQALRIPLLTKDTELLSVMEVEKVKFVY